MQPPRKLFSIAALLSLLAQGLSQQCNGQSCQIAAISGSSGQPIDPSKPPDGSTPEGNCCIISYNPSVEAQIKAWDPSLSCSGSSAQNTTSISRIKRRDPAFEPIEVQLDNVKRAPCTPYTMIFTKGTVETGKLGNFVGPQLESALKDANPGKWTVTGVQYDNSFAGDYCLGLPGGVAMRKVLDTTIQTCPSTKLIVAGYSQGALASHNGMGYSSVATNSKVTGVVVFGDPFDGAPIRNYKGPIKTYCHTGDGVCTGELKIRPAHLSYARRDVDDAVSFINSLVGLR